MSDRALNILLTGPPGCGKTTIIRHIVDGLSLPAMGFYTEEVRGADGRRSGFDVVMLDGRRGPLARVDSTGPRVGKFGVLLEFLEEMALPGMAEPGGVLAVIDEIGKMECLSNLFIQTVRSLLEGETPVIGTLALGGSAFIREVRSRTDIELIEVTERDRERLAEDLIKRFDV